MKIKALIILAFCSNVVFGQYYGNYEINFDNEYGLENLYIDTVSNTKNIWEIGSPNKIGFDSAYSNPNTICTDLNNPYPINDTSVFLIKNLADGGFKYDHTVILAGKYKIDTDSLKDFGRIEFSPDNGTTWIDLLTDTVYQEKWCYMWWSEKPCFTGKTDGWQYFSVWLAGFGNEFDIGGWESNDTVIYKFSFISDSIQTNQDGWILDDLHFEDWEEAIKENKFNTFESFTYPNPANDFVNLEFSNKLNRIYNITIYDINGRIMGNTVTQSGLVEINLSNYKLGTYFYRIYFENKISTGQIIKE